ncbi:MAG: hypothetical protein Kow0042_03960 [Calditrichia bacterium]
MQLLKMDSIFPALIFGLNFWCGLFLSPGLVEAQVGDFPEDQSRQRAIRKAVREELQWHPAATLSDLYKNFFQGRFGPGHLIPDAEVARNYLQTELEQNTEFDTVLWQPVGYEGRYFRVNLRLVREGKISFEQLLDAFVESANTARPPSLDEWKSEWGFILKVIEGMNLLLPDFERDKQRIAENLARGVFIGHHSREFVRTYHPHYRVVSKEQFQRLQQIMEKK